MRASKAYYHHPQRATRVDLIHQKCKTRIEVKSISFEVTERYRPILGRESRSDEIYDMTILEGDSVEVKVELDEG